MAVNKGIYPLDPTSDVGKFRLLIGDTESIPLVPPETGFQNYTMFSDAEIEVFLAQSEGSLPGAAYLAYLQLAASAAMESKSVSDFDLKIDLTKRATDLRLIAMTWKDQWDADSADIFELFPTVPQKCGCVPEAAPFPVCRGWCRGGGLF